MAILSPRANIISALSVNNSWKSWKQALVAIVRAILPIVHRHTLHSTQLKIDMRATRFHRIIHGDRLASEAAFHGSGEFVQHQSYGTSHSSPQKGLSG